MNTNLNNIDALLKDFDNILNFGTDDEELEHEKQMIMFRFLSEVERVYIEQTGEKRLNKKKLAERIGKTPSFVTQLFNGNKNLNFDILAKFQKVLDVKFEIKARESFEASAVFNNDSFDCYRQKHFTKEGFWTFHNLKNKENNKIGAPTNTDVNIELQAV